MRAGHAVLLYSGITSAMQAATLRLIPHTLYTSDPIALFGNKNYKNVINELIHVRIVKNARSVFQYIFSVVKMHPTKCIFQKMRVHHSTQRNILQGVFRFQNEISDF